MLFSGVSASCGNHNVILDARSSKNESIFIAIYDSQVPGIGERCSTARSESKYRCRFRRGRWLVILYPPEPFSLWSWVKWAILLNREVIQLYFHDIQLSMWSDLICNGNSYWYRKDFLTLLFVWDDPFMW